MLAAGLLWSTSGAFVKNLELPDVTIAVYRSGIAGAAILMLFFFRGGKATWSPLMPLMVACFGLMNYSFIASMTRTSAANTIFLQYTAPLWMFLGSVLILREMPERRNAASMLLGMLGIAILLVGNWRTTPERQLGIGFGLCSGLTYAGIALFLRRLRDHDSLWLASINHLGAAVLIACGCSAAAFVSDGATTQPLFMVPTAGELTALALFGTLQMALPYVLFGIGLRYITPQEAGLLTLVEPMVNPLWTYLFAGEVPSPPTMVGGGVLLATLVVRYILPNRAALKSEDPKADG